MLKLISIYLPESFMSSRPSCPTPAIEKTGELLWMKDFMDRVITTGWGGGLLTTG